MTDLVFSLSGITGHFSALLGWDVPYPSQTRPAAPAQVMDSRAALCSSTQSSDPNASHHRASHRHPKAEEGNLNAIYAPELQERPSTEAETLQDLGADIS